MGKTRMNLQTTNWSRTQKRGLRYVIWWRTTHQMRNGEESESSKNWRQKYQPSNISSSFALLHLSSSSSFLCLWSCLKLPFSIWSSSLPPYAGKSSRLKNVMLINQRLLCANNSWNAAQLKTNHTVNSTIWSSIGRKLVLEQFYWPSLAEEEGFCSIFGDLWGDSEESESTDLSAFFFLATLTKDKYLLIC